MNFIAIIIIFGNIAIFAQNYEFKNGFWFNGKMFEKTIFPKRKIAKLKNGYEASFIAVPENPLENFEAVKNITFRFKQGIKLK